MGLFAVSFAVRLPWLWEVPRFIDELREVDLDHEIFRGQAWPLHNAAWDIGALHNYILAGIFQAFGPNIWWPRLYVAVTSALTVVLIYKLGKLLFGKAAGLLAAACLAANGMHILVTHMAWSNSTTPFFFALALYGTLKAEKRGSGLGLPVGFLWALALQTHSSVIIYVLAVAGYLAKKDRLRKAVPAGIGFLLGYGNMIYFNLVSHFGSVAWLSRKTYTLEQQPGIFSFCRNAGRMLVQYLRTVSSTYFEAANPLAYLEQPQFVLAAVALLLGCCLAKKEGKNLPLWLLAASFATIPWLNTRYSFYLPTRYIMPVALVGILLMAKGGIGLWDFLFKNKTARICAGTGTLILLILQLVPHYRYCRSLAGTDMANTTAFAITQQARRLAGGRGIVFVDPSLPVENDPLPVLFKLAGQNQAKLTRSLPAANSRTTPQLAVLSKASFIRLKGTAPLKLRKKFTCRLARAGEKKREIYLVELNAQRGVPVGGWR